MKSAIQNSRVNLNNEQKNILRRSQYLLTPDGFYFKTREGFNFGPYQNLTQVKVARQILINNICGVKRHPSSVATNKINLITIEHFIAKLPQQWSEVA